MNTTTAAWRYVLTHLGPRRRRRRGGRRRTIPRRTRFREARSRVGRAEARPRGRRATPIDARCRGATTRARPFSSARRVRPGRARGVPGERRARLATRGPRGRAPVDDARAGGRGAERGPRNAAGDAITVPATPRRRRTGRAARRSHGADAWTQCRLCESASHLRCDAWLGIRSGLATDRERDCEIEWEFFRVREPIDPNGLSSKVLSIATATCVVGQRFSRRRWRRVAAWSVSRRHSGTFFLFGCSRSRSRHVAAGAGSRARGRATAASSARDVAAVRAPAGRLQTRDEETGAYDHNIDWPGLETSSILMTPPPVARVRWTRRC